MTKFYNALIVDDRKDFADGFANSALLHNIRVAKRTNYKAMVEFLPNYKDKLCTIVLDIKCLMDEDQEVEHESFLSVALNFLTENYPHIPRVILTADSVAYETVAQWFPSEKIYRKKSEDIEKIFKEIVDNGEKIDSIKIRHKYSSIFKIFEQEYLPSETENDVLNLLLSMEDNDLPQVKKNLSAIRRIQENVLQILHKVSKDLIPDECLKPNKDIKFRSIHKHLSGNKNFSSGYKPTTTVYYDGLIEAFSNTIYTISSDNGAHNPYENPNYMPTKYTVIALTNALLDFLLWFNNIVEQHMYVKQHK